MAKWIKVSERLPDRNENNNGESKIDDSHIAYLKEIAEIIKILSEDSNLYLKMLAELSGKGMAHGKNEEITTADTAE